MKTKKIWIIGSIVVVLALLLGIFGCAEGTTTTQTTTTQTTTTQTTTTQTTTTQTTTPATKTLKIGAIEWLSYPLGLQAVYGTQIRMDEINASGGLLIGGERYNLELIYYDSKNDPSTATAAANRLVFVDGVKFILGDNLQVDPWLPVTEANKVIVCASPQTKTIFNTNYHYCFNTGCLNMGTTVGWGWLVKNYPELKTVVTWNTDDLSGHAGAENKKRVIEHFGLTLIAQEYIPADATDLSTLGLKIANLNPDVADITGGGMAQDSIMVKACYQAGYKGQLFAPIWIGTTDILAIAPPEAAEGIIASAMDIEFESPPTEMAQVFRNTWIERHGLPIPSANTMLSFEVLRTALEQAGSLDPDKVAAVIGNGLKWVGPEAPGQMVPRPDLGVTRTVDSVIAYSWKQIRSGKPVVIGKLSLEDAVKDFLAIFHQ